MDYANADLSAVSQKVEVNVLVDDATTVENVDYLGLAFDPRTIDEIIVSLTSLPLSPCVTVVTPNVDHIVRLHRAKDVDSASLWPAYRDASLRLCDSRIVARLARLNGVVLSVVPGSDLTKRLFACIPFGETVAVIGGDLQTADELAALRSDIVLVQHVPPMQMLLNPAAMDAATAFIVEAGARFTFLAVGSPQQELLAMHVRASPGAQGVILCIGAGIEFLTGRIQRAPVWVQRASIEWLHRLLSNPRRMWRRYLVEGPRIFRLAWQFRN